MNQLLHLVITHEEMQVNTFQKSIKCNFSYEIKLTKITTTDWTQKFLHCLEQLNTTLDTLLCICYNSIFLSVAIDLHVGFFFPFILACAKQWVLRFFRNIFTHNIYCLALSLSLFFFLKYFLVVFWVKDHICKSMVLDPTVHSLKLMRAGDGRFAIGKSLL